MKLTRREMLMVGASLAAGAAHAAAPPAGTVVKISKEEAQYQPVPKGMFSCATCTFFIKPGACKVVTGDISPLGWCKLFDLPD